MSYLPDRSREKGVSVSATASITAPSRAAGTAYCNLSPAALIEHALRREEGVLADSGALTVDTGEHTGRSPQDKYVVRDGPLADEIWWGSVNQPMTPEAFARLRADVREHLAIGNTYRLNLSVGADPDYALPVHLCTERAWTALFASNLFLPARRDAAGEGWTIWHAPTMAANPTRHQTRGTTAIALSFVERQVLIVGTNYAGEVKKAMFTVMNGVLPGGGVAPMHCSANEGADGQTALFFGLSGTGKTTLSTVAHRRLIGDDEHGWSDRGIFNFEGGSYAKTIGLSPASEPEIHRAARQFGTVLENVVLDPATRTPQFDDSSRTENTRAAFPLTHIDPAAGGVGAAPSQVIFLSADASGVLPPVARLTRDQALYWFLCGYTSKLAGTERGVIEPESTFSPCFGSPFLPLPPERYAHLLGDRLAEAGSNVWLVNTGWSGGAYGVGKRMPIGLTRAVIAAILNGSLDSAASEIDPLFGFAIPRYVPTVPSSTLRPRQSWADATAYDAAARRLAAKLVQHFARFAGHLPASVRAAGPAIAANSATG